MKQVIIFLILVSSTTLSAITKEEQITIDSILLLFKQGEIEEAKGKLKNLDPVRYQAIAELIQRSIEQETKVNELERQLAIQKSFEAAINAKIHKEMEAIFTGQHNR